MEHRNFVARLIVAQIKDALKKHPERVYSTTNPRNCPVYHALKNLGVPVTAVLTQSVALEDDTIVPLSNEVRGFISAVMAHYWTSDASTITLEEIMKIGA